MNRNTEMSRELSQSDCAMNEETSIKHRLRSASKGPLLSEGRQTPITFPSEDLAMAEGCVESADEEVEHAGLLQDAWFDKALNQASCSGRETPTSHSGGNKFTNSEAEERMKMSYAAALEEKQRKGEELFNKEAEERLSSLKKYFLDSNAHTGKLTYHTVDGQLWRREELANSEVRMVKTTFREIPLGTVVHQGWPDDTGGRVNSADAEVSGILHPKPKESASNSQRILENSKSLDRTNAVRPPPAVQPDNKLKISNVKGSAFKEFNQAGTNEVGELKERMQRMAAQMEAMQKREYERLSQSENVAKKRGARKRQKSPEEDGSDFSEEDFVYTKEAKPENRRKVTARRGRQRSASGCDRELFPNKSVSKASQQVDEVSGKSRDVRRRDKSAEGDAAIASVANAMVNQWPAQELPVFEGDQWQLFIDAFETMAKLSKWTPEQKLVKFLPCIKGTSRMYLEADDDELLTYEDAKNRLAERYGSNMSAFEVRQRIRNMRRRPGETMESFADRLQAASQKGRIERADKNELFYRAFLDAVSDSPKLQLYLEKQHKENRNARLPDLLRMVREYRERSPTRDSDLEFALNVCLPVDKRKGALTHADEATTEEVAQEEIKVTEEKIEREERKEKINMRDVGYALQELEWVKRVIKANGLHGDLAEKLRQMGSEKTYQEPMAEPLTEQDLNKIRESDYYKNGGHRNYRGRGRGRGRGYYREYGNRGYYQVNAEEGGSENRESQKKE